MSSPRNRGRRVPPKHGARSVPPQFATGAAAAPGAADDEASAASAAEVRAARTRAQNRAAKRATDVNRVRGKVSGRRNRGYSPALLGLGIAVVVVGALVFLVGNPFGSAGPSGSPGDTGPAPTRELAGCPTTAPVGLLPGEKRTITIETDLGDIVIEVDADLAPVAAANFTLLASCGYYDGVIFHRVVPGFVIQGGDGTYGWIDALDTSQVGRGGVGYTFNDEPVNGEYTRGTVAMANSGPNTNGSQFFICVADLTTSLGKDYTIFGHVTSGMDVVDQIVAAPRDANDLPTDPVVMNALTVVNGGSATPSPAAATPSPAPPTASPGASPEKPQP